MRRPQNSYDDWHHRHRRFPGVAYCIEFLKRPSTSGELVDVVCGELESHAADHVSELLAAVDEAANSSLRLLLLRALENAALESTLSFWSELLRGEIPVERLYAIRALQRINSKESRRVLWEAGEK